jgi:hypothetical protein
MPKLFQRTRPGRPPRGRRTAVSFAPEDLAALGRLLVAGQAVLQERPPVAARLKAAMTRLGVPVPHGL